MNEPTIITKQLYRLSGNKKTNGTYQAVVLDTLDENDYECVCREIIDGDKHFSIIIKNEPDNICSQEVADMVEPNSDMTGIDYLKPNEASGMYFVRYLVGDHTDEASLRKLFEDVEKRIKKVALFRGWVISADGVLTAKKAEYYY